MASEKLFLFFLLFTIMSHDVQGVKRCIKKLMPCVDFLHSDERPSSACCMVLKVELENDVKCFCKLLKNDKDLKAFNATRSEMIQLPMRCGLQPLDDSSCEKSSGAHTPLPPDAPSVPSIPPGSPIEDIPMPPDALSFPQMPTKRPIEGLPRSGADLGKSMISIAGLLIIGGIVSIFILF